jgi:hypothetical protein
MKPGSGEIILRYRAFCVSGAYPERDMNSEIKKYLLRFGPILLIVPSVLYFTQDARAIQTICYKLTMILFALGIAEFVWASWFKPHFGKMEALGESKLSVMVFRGLLYGSFLLAFTLGL